MITDLQKVPLAEDRAASQQSSVRLSGSGIAVDLLAAILARGGLRVTVASAGAHPGPVGVTTVPYTAELMYLLADRFSVPEIADLAMFGRLPAALRATSGVKQSLGFLYHRPGRAHDRRENLQFSVPGEHAEWHAYLPDVEQHTRAIAERYGVHYVAGAQGSKAEPAPASITPSRRFKPQRSKDLALALNCSGSGYSRQIAGTAYFVGVTPFEHARPPKDGGYTQPWSEGTTVHAFRGGWVQVAAFDNHPVGRNRGCAVSVSMSEPKHFEAITDLDELLTQLRERYPDIGLLLRGAHRKGPWSHAAPWTADPQPTADQEPALEIGLDRGEVLFGQDFTLALELVHAAAAILLMPGALISAAATAKSVQTIEGFQSALFAGNDRFASSSRIATQSFESWNASLRVWLLWSISCALALKKIRLDARRSGNWAPASKFDRGVEWFDLAPKIADTVAKSAAAIRMIEMDAVPPPAAAKQVFILLSRRRFIPPLYKFSDPTARRYRLNLSTRLKLLAWTFTVAPKAYRGMLTADNITAVPEVESPRRVRRWCVPGST